MSVWWRIRVMKEDWLVAICWCKSEVVLRFVGVSVLWCTMVLFFWCFGLLVCWYVGVLVCWCVSVLVC